MGASQYRYAVVYDLSDDRERRRVEKLLCGWGHRLQKSVFTVVTPRAGAQRLLRQLEALKIVSGSVILLRLQTQVRTITIGQSFHDPDLDAAYVY